MRTATTWLPPPCCGGCEASATGTRCRCARSATIAGSAASRSTSSAPTNTPSRAGSIGFATWRQDLAKKAAAGQDVSSELLEGAALLRAASDRVLDRHDRDCLAGRGERLRARQRQPGRAGDRGAFTGTGAYDSGPRPDRSDATRYERVLTVLVERERARFGAWYEMFPRSAGTDPTRSATFDEAAARLPYVASMGFDVLYLPPIHPIGRSFRKGPNNADDSRPERSGQPLGDRLRRGWPHGRSSPGSARWRTSIASSRPPDAIISRSRSTSRFRRRPIIPMSGNIRSGSGIGPTARSSTPRTRRRSIRTSTRSTSSRPTGRRSGTS